MKTSSLLLAAGLACFSDGLPLEKRQNIDNVVLQFALTLEHLENVFYKGALKKFSLYDFQKAGYSADYYNNLNYIAHDEEQHVLLLEAALTANGQTPVQACTYSFPYYDVPSFITLSSVLEGVGTSAYLGGAPLITSKYYLSVAGSILITEALHTSMQRGAIGEVPMANPYGTALDPTSVYTLAAAFIVSCPSSNTPLPFTAFPSLQIDGNTCTCEEPYCGQPSEYVKRDGRHGWPGQWNGPSSNNCVPPSAGGKVEFSAASNIPKGSYVTFVNGLSVVSVAGNVYGKKVSAAIPAGIEGQTYVFVTSSDVEGTLDDTKVVFGPAVLEVKPQPPSINYSILKS